MPFPRIKIVLLVVAQLVSFWGSGQFRIPEKPTGSNQTSLYDYVDLLDNSQAKALEQKLIRYSDSTSTQIVIAIIASTEGEDIQYVGAQWGQAWGIGQEKEDNGILILLARDDRRIGINTGYGVEAFLTDALSKRIIETIILPEFRNGDYYSGLDKGVEAIFQVLTGQFKIDTRAEYNDNFPLSSLLPFLLFIIILIILASRKNKGGGSGPGGRRGPDIWDMIILSNMGKSGSSGGFGGGGFSGGGFSGGFGGGGFGGGGSSGGW